MLRDNLEWWDGVGGGREIQEEGAYVHLSLIHVDVWQRPTQHYKAIILQLKEKEQGGRNKQSSCYYNTEEPKLIEL